MIPFSLKISVIGAKAIQLAASNKLTTLTAILYNNESELD